MNDMTPEERLLFGIFGKPELEIVTEERDRARAVAVELEQRLARVERMASTCERKAAEDRAAKTATVGESVGLDRRAANYEIVAQGLRAALNPEADQ